MVNTQDRHFLGDFVSKSLHWAQGNMKGGLFNMSWLLRHGKLVLKVFYEGPHDFHFSCKGYHMVNIQKLTINTNLVSLDDIVPNQTEKYNKTMYEMYDWLFT